MNDQINSIKCIDGGIGNLLPGNNGGIFSVALCLSSDQHHYSTYEACGFLADVMQSASKI